MSTEQYAKRARFKAKSHAAQANFVEQQWAQATKQVDAEAQAVIVCGCGHAHRIAHLFRCFFCGVFFCEGCAKDHFGEEECHL